jgi:alpha-1,3/alpha-1,6-mannosyltransferase
MMTLASLVDTTKRLKLTFSLCTPSTSEVALPPFVSSSTSTPDVVFLLNFATSQRSALLSSPHTLALLYTPTNEHFGIVPIEAMISGLVVLATNTGGPTESVLDPDFPGSYPKLERTGWLRPPEVEAWAAALEDIAILSKGARSQLSQRAKKRAEELFSMDSMSKNLQDAIYTAVDMGPVPGLPLLLLLLIPSIIFLVFVLRS